MFTKLRIPIFAFIWFVAAVAGAQNAMYSDLPAGSFDQAELKVMQTNTEAVSWLRAMNAAHIKGIAQCFCAVKNLPQCNSGRTHMTYEFISGAGNYRKRVESCGVVVQKYISERVPAELSEMRKFLALSSSESLTFDVESYISGRENKADVMKINLNHPFKMPFFNPNIAPMTELEQQEALKDVDKERARICSDFIAKNIKRLAKFFGNSNQQCSDILGIPKRQHMSYEQAILGSKIYRDFLPFVVEQIAKYEEDNRQKYFLKINDDPLLLFLNRPEFNDIEIYNALNEVHQRALEQAKRPTTLSALSVYRERWALPYTEAMLKKRDPSYDYRKSLQDLVVKGQKADNLLKDVKLGAAVGAFFACELAPFGGVVRGIAFVASKSLCRLLVTAITDSYFLVDGILAFNQSEDEFLSVIESVPGSIDAEELLSEKMQVYLSAMLMPLGPYYSK